MHPNLGFGCFPSIVKLCLDIQKKCFDETVLLSTQNTCPWYSSIIEIVIFVVTCWRAWCVRLL